MLQFHTVFALAFGICVALVLVLRPLAVRVGLVDVPDSRKRHSGPVPLIGGLAIFLTAVLVHSLPEIDKLPVYDPTATGFLLSGLVLVVVGLADDLFELSIGFRFIAQIAAALVLVYASGAVLQDLGQLAPGAGHLGLGILAVPFTVFATVGVINALNMCDGLDGLSGTQTMISLTGFAVAVGIWGEPTHGALLALLAGATAGFLLFNLRLPGLGKAVVFLGDAGSMFLGLALAWCAIAFSQGPDAALSPAAALWFVLVPTIDAVAMMLRRILKRRSPFYPDREHLHHIFLLAGFSVSQTVAIMAGIGAFGVAVGLISTWLDWPDMVIAGAFLGAGLLYLIMIMHAWRVMRLLGWPICRRRSAEPDRRVLTDRRMATCANFSGPERRSWLERRHAHAPRRASDRAVPRSESFQPSFDERLQADRGALPAATGQAAVSTSKPR
ncbi:MAG: undecaprenyl/decaprenyl-phosphate alpha-N-acetylglucosaminyl 1-phosphate transferase [Gammaproteobacteria bacterium]|nr:undecaprenyl/decaprenyl-phosphate alpha-N-acetylglucosaminyl 1-phosphate transferase [Gammaproteobacteria bacterium]